MIASVRGRVLAVDLETAVVEVGGVGMLVRATPATLAGLRVGEEALLATSLVVREDSLTLFGFADDDERTVFDVVQTVSGVGPKLALAMLAIHPPDVLRRAVAGQDVAALVQVPGIGKKGAQRILLDLEDKLGAPRSEVPPAVAVPVDPRGEDVVEALVNLGWPQRAAGVVVEEVLASASVPPDTAGILRAALQRLGGSHG